jgi:hypothetical protein
MWVERQNPARKVVRFRGTLVDSEGTVAHTDVESGSALWARRLVG